MIHRTLYTAIVADDHPHYQSGFCNALKTRADFNRVEQVANGEELIRLALEIKPNLILADIVMPIINGIQATRVLKEELPDVKIIGLALYQPERLIEKMLNAGAHGYFLKNGELTLLHQAIDEVMYQSGKFIPNERNLEDEIKKIGGFELF